jgi:hypothetical protein
MCFGLFFIQRTKEKFYVIFGFFILAIVPIEYFSERNVLNGNTNGTKIKSINEENRV